MKFAAYASLAMLLENLVQVTESISGSVVPLAMFSQNSQICFSLQVYPFIGTNFQSRLGKVDIVRYISYTRLIEYYVM